MLGAAALFAFALLLIACAGGIVLRQFHEVSDDKLAAESISQSLHFSIEGLKGTVDRLNLDIRDLTERNTQLERVLKASQALIRERLPTHATTGAAP